MPHHLIIASIISLAATAARADTELPMPDLVALDKQKQWSELLDGADRVKPAARTVDWARLVTAAATHIAEQIERAGSSGLRQAQRLIELVPAAEHKYAFLVGDPGYLDAKAKALQGVATACDHEANARCGAILAMLADTMMPEAFAAAHDLAGLITVAGFLTAFLLTKLGG